jgi:hypothetical protein
MILTAEEERIRRDFANDPVKIGGFGEGQALEQSYSVEEDRRKTRALPESIRLAMIGRNNEEKWRAQHPESWTVPILDQELQTLAGKDEKTAVLPALLDKDNQRGNQSGEYILQKEAEDLETKKKGVLKEILQWSETVQTQRSSMALDRFLIVLVSDRAKVNLELGAAERIIAKIENSEERRITKENLRQLKKYIEEFDRLSELEKQELLIAVEKRLSGQNTNEMMTGKIKQFKKKPEKGNPFARLFGKKHGIEEEKN